MTCRQTTDATFFTEADTSLSGILQSSEDADCCGGGNDMMHLVGTGQEALAEMPVDLLAFHR